MVERAHHYVHLNWGIWRCKNCGRTRWQPVDYNEAEHYANNLRKHGAKKAEALGLEHHPKLLWLLIILERIRILHPRPQGNMLATSVPMQPCDFAATFQRIKGNG